MSGLNGSKSERARRLFSLGTTVAVTVALVLFLSDHREDLGSFRHANPALLALALGLSTLRLSITGLISRYVVLSLHGSIGFLKCFSASSVAAAANLFLPAHSGIAVRAFYLCRHGGCSWPHFLSALTAVQFLHGIVTCGLAFWFLFFLEGGVRRNAVLSLSAGVLCACISVMLVVHSVGQREWMGRRLGALAEGWMCFSGSARLFALTGLLCLSARLIESACYWVVARAMGLDISYPMVVGITSVGSMAALAGLTPGGFGLYEGAIGLVSEVAGINPAQAMVVALACRGVHAVRTALLAPLGMWSLSYKSTADLSQGGISSSPAVGE